MWQWRCCRTGLAVELDGFPLALAQAAAYIVEKKATFGRYLGKLSHPVASSSSHCAFRPWDVTRSRWPPPGSTNFDAVQEASPAAADVLRFSAFLAPDAIPFELLILRGFRARAFGRRRPSPRPRPTPYSSRPAPPPGPLLADSRRRDDESYGVHRLVQAVLKDSMDEPTRRLWGEWTPWAVGQAFPSVDYGTWPECGRLLPHALAVASQIQARPMEFDEARRLQSQTAYYLHQRGQYADAEPLYVQAMEIAAPPWASGTPTTPSR